MRRPLHPGCRLALTALFVASIAAGCGAIQSSAPPHAPESFPEIVSQLGRFGVVAENWVAGDAGCSDATLGPTAIRFEASGLDQATPVPLRIYIFRNRETWERRRVDVDACVGEWAVEPATFEFVDPSPYVLAGPGPWPPEFKAGVRRALDEAAGSGG